MGGNFWGDYNGNDSDSDGIGDSDIPYTSNNRIVNGGDYLPLIENSDIDGDGILNNIDNCPTISNPFQEDSNNNSVGDLCDIFSDSDNDFILDIDDRCPLDNPDGLDVDLDGCTDTIVHLINTVKSFNFEKGLTESLVKKLENSKNNVNNNNNRITTLNAFINEVNAQRNKLITDSQADLLVQMANNVILSFS